MSSATCTSPRRSRSQSIFTSPLPILMSPIQPSSKRAFSVASSPRPTRTGKRARRVEPPSRPVRTIATFSFDHVPAMSTLTSLASVPTNLTPSASSMPLLPSSSSSFFPPLNPALDPIMQLPSSPPLAPRNSRAKLHDLHREAFTSLRQSVAESGEGFVRRMREWEQLNRGESGKITPFGNYERSSDHEMRHSVRNGRTHRPDHQTASGTFSSHSHEANYMYSADLSGQDIQSRNEPQYPSIFNGQDDTDDDDEILIDSSCPFPPSKSSKHKARSISLGDSEMDVVDSPELFNVDFANNGTERFPPAHHTSVLDFPYTCSVRSSSPVSLNNTSDDDFSSGSRYEHTYSGFSSPHATSCPLDWSMNPASTQTPSQTSSEHLYPTDDVNCCHPGISPPLHTTQRHLHSPFDSSATQSPTIFDGKPVTLGGEPASDTALATLILALASGSGSLADYGYVRDAQGELEELEAGALWE